MATDVYSKVDITVKQATIGPDAADNKFQEGPIFISAFKTDEEAQDRYSSRRN